MCYDQRRKREDRRNIGRQFSTSCIGIVLRVWQKDNDVQINSYELRDRAKDEHYYVLGEAIENFPETMFVLHGVHDKNTVLIYSQ